MKIKTSDLIGPALRWAVLIAETPPDVLAKSGAYWAVITAFHPDTDWAHGGPLIEREDITVRPVFRAERTESDADVYRKDGWAAHVEPKAFWITPRPFAGPTPLIAAMRCFVASKLGEEVEIPDELFQPTI